jgi:hypothetical protein
VLLFADKASIGRLGFGCFKNRKVASDQASLPAAAVVRGRRPIPAMMNNAPIRDRFFNAWIMLFFASGPLWFQKS